MSISLILERIHRMKIMHLLGSCSLGGAERIASSIIFEYQQQYDMVYCSPDGEVRDYLRNKNIRFIPLKDRSFFCLFREVLKYKPNVIHAHDYWASFMASILPFKFSLISHLHSTVPFSQKLGLKSLLFAHAVMRSNLVVGVSNEVFANHYLRKILDSKSVVIPNAINFFDIEKKSKRDSVFGGYDLLFVGRLHESKDPLFFVKVIASILKKGIPVKAGLIGEGPLHEACNEMVRSLGIENSVEFLGFQENPYITMRKSKVLVMTSFYEGFGLVALEAMFLGVPVLARPVGRLKSMIEESGGGFLCFTLEDFVEKAELLLNNHTIWLTLSKKGKSWVIENNNYSNFIKSYGQIYEHLRNV